MKGNLRIKEGTIVDLQVDNAVYEGVKFRGFDPLDNTIVWETSTGLEMCTNMPFVMMQPKQEQDVKKYEDNEDHL